jgi:hypothetical protein
MGEGLMVEVRTDCKPRANNRLLRGINCCLPELCSGGKPAYAGKEVSGGYVFVQECIVLLHQLQFLPDLVNLLQREILPPLGFYLAGADWLEILG